MSFITPTYLCWIVIAGWVPLCWKRHSWVEKLIEFKKALLKLKGLKSSIWRKKSFHFVFSKLWCFKTCRCRNAPHSAANFHLRWRFLIIFHLFTNICEQTRVFWGKFIISPWNFRSAWKSPMRSIWSWGWEIDASRWLQLVRMIPSWHSISIKNPPWCENLAIRFWDFKLLTSHHLPFHLIKVEIMNARIQDARIWL